MIRSTEEDDHTDLKSKPSYEQFNDSEFFGVVPINNENFFLQLVCFFLSKLTLIFKKEKRQFNIKNSHLISTGYKRYQSMN